MIGKEASAKVVTSIDIEQDCISTLKANDLFKDTNVIQGDLHEIKSEWFINELNQLIKFDMEGSIG